LFHAVVKSGHSKNPDEGDYYQTNPILRIFMRNNQLEAVALTDKMGSKRARERQTKQAIFGLVNNCMWGSLD